MKFELSTAKVNSILSRVSKVEPSKVLPITSYIKVQLNKDGLEVTATDSVNFIKYKEPEVTGVEGEAIVLADTLVKLAAKTSKPKMEFTLKDNHLEVKGNGTYNIPVNTEEKFPDYTFEESAKGSEVETKVLKKAFKVNEAAIATEMIMPCLTGFNVGNNVTTTDAVKMCINEVKIFNDVRVLIPQPLAALLETLTAEKVRISKSGSKLLFSTENIDIFGVELDGIEEFPDITPLAEMEHVNHVKVNRTQLIEVLDRMSIFVDKFDNFGVKLTFGTEHLTVQDMKENSSEVVEYKEKTEVAQPTQVVVSIVYLKQLLEVMSREVINMSVEDGLPVKLSEEGLIQVLSTIEEISDTIAEETDLTEEG